MNFFRSIALSLFVAFSASAALSSSQLATLRTAINADATLAAQPNNDDGAVAIAAAFNVAASPSFTVWKTDVTRDAILNAVTYSPEFISNTSQGERDAFAVILTQSVINMALPNIRQGFADIFSGATKATSRQAISAAGKRLATRAEKLFADTSGGAGTNGAPATMTFEGQITISDVNLARAN